MSGAPYPHPNPAPGSNAIGLFIIGVSPVGTITPFDVWTTVLSQYANSPILTALITNMAQYYDPTEDFDNFLDNIWNVDSAQGYGLDVWGRIVGISRTLNIPNSDVYFGFEEGGDPRYQPFDSAPFFSGQPTTSNFDLSDSAYRTLIFAKALTNITDGSIPAVNQMLLNLFPGRGNCYVRDNLDMTMTFVFEFALSAVELAIVQTSGALPKPVGVSFDVSQGFI